MRCSYVIQHLLPEKGRHAKDLDDQKAESLQKLEQLLLPEQVLKLTTRFLVHEGHPSEVIVETARELGVDLIVMGTHGRTGMVRLLMGSVAEKVLRLAPCPVLTIKGSAADVAVKQPTGEGTAAHVRPEG